jgi:diguanylate cyclase (GGDEF)-like protein
MRLAPIGHMAARESSHGTTELRPTVPSLPAARASHAPESGKHRTQAKALLFVVAGPQQGCVFPLGPEAVAIRIGREGDVDMAVNDEAVSAAHVLITRSAQAAEVEDLGSRNGTFLNDELIQGRRSLEPGDNLRLGNTVLKYELFDELEEAALVSLFEQTQRDPLTHAYNRRHFDAQLPRALGFAERHDQSLSILLLDVDRFKGVNDRFGHAVGDVVLKAVSASVQRVLRPADLLSRIGGEEFVVVARDTTLRNAQILAERIRRRVETLPFAVGGQDFIVTVSIGVATAGPASGYPSGERLVASADEAMYVAKLEGRNRVSLAPPPHETSHVRIATRTLPPAATEDAPSSIYPPSPGGPLEFPANLRPPRG